MAQELYGVVSLLDDEHQEAVWKLWEELEREFQLSLRDTHVPHFSYHVAERYDPGRIERLLSEIASSTTPMITRSFFLGVFNAPPPLFFLPLVRTDELSALHRRLWRDLAPISTGILDRYNAESWMATVNLAPDIDRDISAELLPFLLKRNFSWDIRVDNVSLLHDTGTKQELAQRFDLRGR